MRYEFKNINILYDSSYIVNESLVILKSNLTAFIFYNGENKSSIYPSELDVESLKEIIDDEFKYLEIETPSDEIEKVAQWIFKKFN